MTRVPPDDRLAGELAATGVEGLDNVLGGGFTRNRLYHLEGMPGSGKTTLALQFLLEGLRRSETVLYVTLSETVEELRQVAGAHGWQLDGMHLREVVPAEDILEPDEHQTMFHPSEVELTATTRQMLGDVERIKPSRVVIDSLSEFRLLSGTPLRYRRQILALKQFFAGRHCTVLMLDDLTNPSHDLQVRSIAHGVVLLELSYPAYGPERRRLVVLKYRGVRFRGGYHDYAIRTGGLEVYPRLVASEHRRQPPRDRLGSGIAEMDALLGGGIERGTSTLVVGPAGTGKSTLASQFVAAAAARGEGSALFVFDESTRTFLNRATGLGIDLIGPVESGLVTLQQVDPAEMSPGELIHHIREAVDRRQVSIVVIDSLNGYLNAMPDERFLLVQLHDLLMYLGDAGVATILIGTHYGLIGGHMTSPVDATYLADAVVLMRYFEAGGELRQAISVVKKRGGAHERAIREFRLSAGGLGLGPPLREFRGVLTGTPTPVGDHRADDQG